MKLFIKDLFRSVGCLMETKICYKFIIKEHKIFSKKSPLALQATRKNLIRILAIRKNIKINFKNRFFVDQNVLYQNSKAEFGF